jgi:hypothetical protein
MGVHYLGNGVYVVDLGKGEDTPEGASTTTVFRVPPEQIETVESASLLSERPALHPDTGRPLSETEPGFTDNGDGTYTRDADQVRGSFGPTGFVATGPVAKPEDTYTDNHDGTFTRDSDGEHGRFGPTGFVASA